MVSFVEIYNDGKNEYESFEASLDVDTAYFLSTPCYGENEIEAVKNLKDRVEEFILQLQSIDWNKTRQKN